MAGPAGGTEIELADELILGRAGEGVGTFDQDPELSRNHGRITRTPDGALQIEDLGSRNGTFVNDARIRAPQMLRPGDKIKIGTTTLEVVAAGPAPTQMSPIHAPPPSGPAATDPPTAP